MTRSIRKGPFVDHSLSFTLRKIIKDQSFLEKNENVFKPKRVWSRRSFILPSFVNKKFEIHNGKSFVSLLITENMIGHKFGEFAATRKKGIHTKKGKK